MKIYTTTTEPLYQPFVAPDSVKMMLHGKVLDLVDGWILESSHFNKHGAIIIWSRDLTADDVRDPMGLTDSATRRMNGPV